MQAHLNDHCAGPLVGDVSAAYLAQHSLGPARCVGSWFPAGSMACTFAVGLKAGPILLGHNPNPLNQPAVGPSVWPGKFFRKPVPFPDFMASCAVSMSFSILVFSSKQGHLVVRNIVISRGPRQRRRAPVLTSMAPVLQLDHTAVGPTFGTPPLRTPPADAVVVSRGNGESFGIPPH